MIKAQGRIGADVIVEFLKAKGVSVVFCITGAGNLAIVDAIYRDGSIRVVFSHHEQAAVMEAQGFSRVSGSPGVALVTTGGGTSNVVTGALSAHLDSIPVFLISGNESSYHCEDMKLFRAFGVQGFDSTAVLGPVTKISHRVLSASDLKTDLAKLWGLMLEGRHGPVHLDVPMDLQRQFVSATPESSKQTVNNNMASLNLKQIDDIRDVAIKLSQSSSPVFYFGQGIRSNDALASAKRIVERFAIPYFVSWSAIDLFDDADPLNFGRVGIYGDRFSNILLQKCSLLVAVGTRLAIPQVGYDRQDFARNARKIVVDIDAIELTKFEGELWETLNSDSTVFLENLERDLSDLEIHQNKGWVTEGARVRKALPRLDQVGERPASASGFVHSADVMECLNQVLEPDAVIVTDVGAALLTGHSILATKPNQRLFTSQGLGEMGFGLPGALGAHFADPSRQIICLNTDGAMMFNIQEMQLASQESVPLKLFVFNNDGYSMIKISQENLFDGRYSGSTPSSGVTFPKFSDLAKTFNFGYTRVDSALTMEVKIAQALQSEGPQLVEIIMDPSQKYLPRLATSKLKSGGLVSPPLEDLDPKIDLELLEDLLGYKASNKSYEARGVELEKG